MKFNHRFYWVGYQEEEHKVKIYRGRGSLYTVSLPKENSVLWQKKFSARVKSLQSLGYNEE